MAVAAAKALPLVSVAICKQVLAACTATKFIYQILSEYLVKFTFDTILGPRCKGHG